MAQFSNLRHFQFFSGNPETILSDGPPGTLQMLTNQPKMMQQPSIKWGTLEFALCLRHRHAALSCRYFEILSTHQRKHDKKIVLS